MSALDQTLDELIDTNKPRGRGGRQGRGNRGRGGRRRRRGNSGNGKTMPSQTSNPLMRGQKDDGAESFEYTPRQKQRRQRPGPYNRSEPSSQWRHDMYQSSGGSGSGNRIQAEPKIFVSNLESDLTEEDIEGIFGDVGTINSVVIHCDREGRSLGSAEIVFTHTADAQTAVDEFDEARVDERPMYVRLVTSLAPKPRTVVKKYRDTYDNGYGGQDHQANRRSRGGRGRGRGRGRNRGRGRGPSGGTGRRGGRKGSQGKAGRQQKDKPVNIEDLDREMDEYHTRGAGSGGAVKEVSSAGQPKVDGVDAAGQPVLPSGGATAAE